MSFTYLKQTPTLPWEFSLGTQAMYYQMDDKTSHKGQYSNSGGKCYNDIYTKSLLYHLSHFTKTAMSIFDSDAESFFDRIVMLFALVCYMIWGAPTSAMSIWESTLHHTYHHVKSAYRITKDHYCYTPTNPIIRPSQGSKAESPTCSTSIFLLLMIINKLAKSISFCAPHQHLSYETKAIVFADNDTNFNKKFDT